MLHLLAKNRSALLAAAALLAGASGVANAEPAHLDAAAPVMTLGAAAVPPVGFLDLCERSPVACGAAEADAVNIAALRTAAMRNYWADTFAQRRSGPAAGVDGAMDWSRVFADARRERGAPRRSAVSRGRFEAVAAGDVDSASTPSSAIADTVIALLSAQVADAASAVAAGDVAGSAVETQAGAMVAFAAMAADEAASPVEPTVTITAPVTAKVDEPAEASVPVFAFDRAGWKLVNGVNRRVNRSVRQTADSRLYGVEDFWTLPGAGRGDCEDFVLAKREALIEAGVPAEVLSIAIVETRWGESHAVLLLASDRGEYVLDSLSPWVSRWDRLDYAWKERQRPGHPFDWVTAAI